MNPEPPPLRVLLVEDNPGDARLVREHLGDATGFARLALEDAGDLETARRRLADPGQPTPDVALVDLSLPDAQGLETLTRIQEALPALPVVVLTGFDDEEVAVQAVRAGAQDYLVKGRIDGNLLHQAIRYAIERKRTQEALRQANGDLERRVELRTAELRASNERLHVEVRERRAAEAQIGGLLRAEQHARAEVEAANRSKDEFLATLSHELRTPLSAILGWAEILRGGELEASEVREGLAVIDRNARALARLVEDVLEVSRIVCGKLGLEHRLLDLVAVVDAALTSTYPAARAKDLRLTRSFEVARAPLEGDADRLQQVVWNLLSNAVKFTPAGGQVEVRLRRHPGGYQVEVADTGIGINPSFLPHVFDRFRQLDGSTTRAYGGLGLGLSIARHLVEMHGGQISAESPGTGRGATFSVVLPFSRRREVAPGTGRTEEGEFDPESAAASRPAGETSALPSLGGARVLLVEDETDARRALTHLFRRSQAEVREAASVAEAIATLGEFAAEVLVSDLAMPGEDGFDLVRRLRDSPVERWRTLPALALSALARPEDRARALAAGFDHHLPKPSEPHEIIRVVQELLAGRRPPVPVGGAVGAS